MSLNITLAEYYQALDEHNWWYMMDKDPTIRAAGYKERNVLAAISHLTDAHKDLFDRFYWYHIHKATYQEPEFPKPSHPVQELGQEVPITASPSPQTGQILSGAMSVVGEALDPKLAVSVSVTGRIVDHSPNLQNIPIHTPEGDAIREAFVHKE